MLRPGRQRQSHASLPTVPCVSAGDDAKALVDQWTDACAAVINLRTAIMRYRKPKSSARFYRHAALSFGGMHSIC